MSSLRLIVAALVVLSFVSLATAQDPRDMYRRYLEKTAELDQLLPNNKTLRDEDAVEKIKEKASPLIVEILNMFPEFSKWSVLDDIADRKGPELRAIGYILKIDDIIKKLDADSAHAEVEVHGPARCAKHAVDYFNAETEEARAKVLAEITDFAKKNATRPEFAGAFAFMLSVAEDTAAEDRILDVMRKNLNSVTANTVILQYQAPRKLKGLIGKTINFRYQTHDAKPLQAADFRGKVLMLHFFQASDEYNLKALNRAVRFYVTNRAKGLELVVVSSDAYKADLTLWMQKNRARINYPILFDDFTANSSKGWHPLTLELGVSKLPSTLLIDRKGNLRFANPEKLEESIKQLVDETP
jgi:peroxiredoxin